MNLALADIRHNLVRFLMTSVGLGLLMGVALSMVGIYQGVVTEALALSRAMHADLWVVEAGTRGPFAEASRIPGDVREMVARLPGVDTAGSITLQTVEAASTRGPLRLQIIGYEPSRPGGPTDLTEGRMLGDARYEIIADSRSRLPLGATIGIANERYAVVGTTHGLVASGGDPLIFMSLKDSQQIQFQLAPPASRRASAAGNGGAGTDTVNAVIARLSPNADPATVATHAMRWKHLSALTDQEQSDLLTFSVVNRARVQLGIFTVVLLFVSAVIIALIIYTMTMDKLREIATLKLIGATDRTIIGLVLQQALILGGTGYVSGAVLIFLTRGVFPRTVDLGPGELLFMAGVTFVICVLGSVLSIRAALRIDPQQALGG
jgi:putative ABC transport system permease protein